ncbi:hypothetical protein L195_g020418 [Trifolium pratense]|uniref:Uncharacterized protein n=1 Tax=Trifolium pratense TaxID=57577 RepID=A0A2K3N2C1_TRIPR|nr:hypothetical protein L195_g020418 [Trifolium pratense]
MKIAECRATRGRGYEKLEYRAIICKKRIVVLTDFGVVDDGKTSSTKVFPYAIKNLSQYAYDSGALLVVTHGKWLIEIFNLTSHFTIFLQNEVVILASQDELEWASLHVLASYGRGRDAHERLNSLIFGTNLSQLLLVLVTMVHLMGMALIGGTIFTWMNELKLNKAYLIELTSFNHIQSSILTLINSPSWPIARNSIDGGVRTFVEPATMGWINILD